MQREEDFRFEWENEFFDEFFNEINLNKTNIPPNKQIISNNDSHHSNNSEILKTNESSFFVSENSISNKNEKSRCHRSHKDNLNTRYDNDYLINNDLYQISDRSNGIPKIESSKSLEKKELYEINESFNHNNFNSTNSKSLNSPSELPLKNYVQNNEIYNITQFSLKNKEYNEPFESDRNNNFINNEVSNSDLYIPFQPTQISLVKQNALDLQSELIDLDDFDDNNNKINNNNDCNDFTIQMTSKISKEQSKLNTEKYSNDQLFFSNFSDDEFNAFHFKHEDNTFKPKPKPRRKKPNHTNFLKDELIIDEENPKIIFSNTPWDLIFNNNNNNNNNNYNNNNNNNNNNKMETKLELSNNFIIQHKYRKDSFSDESFTKDNLIKTNEIDSFWEEICTENNKNHTRDYNSIKTSDSLSNQIKPQPKKRQRFLFTKDNSIEKLYSSLKENQSNSRLSKHSFNKSGFSNEVLNNGDLFWNSIFKQYEDRKLNKMFDNDSMFDRKSSTDNLKKTPPPRPPKPKILPPIPPKKPIYPKPTPAPIPKPRKKFFLSEIDLSSIDDKDSCVYDSEPDISAFDLTPKQSKNKKFFSKIKNYFKQNVIIKQNKNL